MTRKVDTELATSTRCEQMVPPWIQRMRDMAQKHLTAEVVEKIITNQIEAAKAGDRNAIRFVFDQLMGGQALRGATFVQNNYGAEFGDDHASPTAARPGTPDKIAAMTKRVANGQSLSQPGDAKVDGWECVSCGHEAKDKPDCCPKCGRRAFEKIGK